MGVIEGDLQVRIEDVDVILEKCYRTPSWHLIGFPDGDDIGSTV